MSFDRLTLLLVPLLLVACAAEAPTEPVADASISAQEFERHLAALASDEFAGRAPATPGGQKTVEYISAAFEALGLEPGNDGSYLQKVPLVEITADPDASLSFETPAGEQALEYGPEMVVWTKRVAPSASIEDSELVFVGHGVVAPEYDWDDYAGIDMRGKTAVILINDPGFATNDPELFRGEAMTYYGRWTYKYEEAARQGADGAIIIHETVPAAYGWDTVANSWMGPQLDMESDDGNAGRVSIEGWITLDRAKQLLDAAGKDFDELKAAAQKRGFRPVPLDATATAAVRNTIRHSESANVIGVLPGSERPDESILYMAHWDHLGTAGGGEAGEDRIFNGAVDNATGVAGLIAIAGAFTRAPAPPERSIVFLAVTAEESGLLGSAYYVEHPSFELARTVGVLNMDAMYFGGPTRDVSVVGYGASELQDYLARAAAAQDRVLEPEPTPEKGFYYRSDHFNFAKHGVPALYTKLGIDDREHGIEWGKAQQAEYTAERYHKAGDEFEPGIDDLRGSIEDVNLLLAVGRDLADETTFPEWSPGNEFRAIREESRARLASDSRGTGSQAAD